MALPPGQRYRSDFPRFGLSQFADRIVDPPTPWSVAIGGDVETGFELDLAALAELPRVEQTSDFHCVTTWSAKGLRWGGWRFRDVYESLLRPRAAPDEDATFVTLQGLDGYTTVLRLEDALADDVLLADTLDGAPLCQAHGAPLRVVAPRHYGFKSAEHLKRIDLTRDQRLHKRPVPLAFMDHLRARVDLEERGQLPGWFLRVLYRPLIASTVRKFARAAAAKR